MMEKSQGGQANRTGSVLESQVQNIFSNYGFTAMAYADYKKGTPLLGDLLIKNYPYESIYGHSAKSEFLVVSASRNMRVRIECKWQHRAGSVDEKFPYLMLNCERVEEPLVIILIDGGGYKPGALEWIKNAARNCKTKDIRVYSLGEFITWAHKALG